MRAFQAKLVRLSMMTASIAAMTAMATPAVAQAAVRQFDIPSQPLSSALLEFSKQSDVMVVISPEAANGKRAPAVRGSLPVNEAIGRLLRGSGLRAVPNPRGGYRIERETASAPRATQSAAASPGTGEARTASSSGDGEAEADEIVVTAQKRQQVLGDVPMSISVVSSSSIRDRALVNLSDAVNSLPSVSVLDQGPGFNSVVVRGLAASPQTDAAFNGSPLSGVYLGEIPVSGLGVQGNSADLKLVDIERIEVLRGPQGTLYGAGAMGGVIRNIPVAPKLQSFEGAVTATYSNTARLGSDNVSVDGVLNIPLIEDVLAIRAVGYHYRNSGYYRNVAADDATLQANAPLYGGVILNQNDIGASTYTGGRVSVLWQPNSDLSGTLTFIRQVIEQDGWGQADVGIDSNPYSQRRYQMRLRGAGPPTYGTPSNKEGLSDRLTLANLVLNYDFPWGTLTSSTSYAKETSELDREIADFFDFVPVSQPVQYLSKAWMQEVRLATRLNGPFQAIVGGYYEDKEQATDNLLLFGGDPALEPFGDMLYSQNVREINLRQISIFGEGSFDFTEQFRLVAGARYFHFARDLVDDRIAGAFVVPSTTLATSKEDGVRLKASVEYRPRRSALLYATWSQGFRLGYPVPADVNPRCDVDGDGIYDGSNGISTGPRNIDSDRLDNFELGGKFGFLGNRLTINAAAFRMNWKGIPVSQTFSFCGAVVNAGQARSQGLETEVRLEASDALSLNLAASYVDAKLTADAPGLGALAGDRLPGAPRYTLSGGAEYSFEVFGRKSFLRADYSYVGGYYNSLAQTGSKLGDYGLLGASAGIQFDHVRLIVFGQNLTNENALTWTDVDVNVFERGNRLRPRTIGIRATTTF